MTELVQIGNSDESAVITPASALNVAIIGRATSYSGLTADVNNVSVLDGVLSTDSLYIAIDSFLAIAGSNANVIAYGIPSAGETLSDVELLGTGLNWYVPYTPITSASNTEIYVTGLTFDGTGVDAGWYGLDNGYTWTQANSIYNGAMVIDDSGVEFTSGSTTVTGVLMDDTNYRLRADIVTDPMSQAFEALTDPTIAFQYLVFAYDPSLSSSDTGSTSYKYASGNCYSETSWLKDLFIGEMMAAKLSSQNQECAFVFSIPEKRVPNETIDDITASGTSYTSSGTAIKYEDLYSIVGTAKHYIQVAAKQEADSGSIDPAIEFVAQRMVANPRKTAFAMPTTIGQLESPKNPEAVAWKKARTNVVLKFVGVSTYTWGANYTFGNGNQAYVNYMQPMNLLRRRIKTRLSNLILTRSVPYDMRGIDKTKAVIDGACLEAVNVDGWFDGYIKTVIPIEPYIKNEGSLSDADQAILDAARDSKAFSGIQIYIKYNGDVEMIIIDFITSGE